jgi:hypothetical protein
MIVVAANPGLTTASVLSASGWYWDTGRQPLKGWTLTSQNWRGLIEVPNLCTTQLNSRWMLNWEDQTGLVSGNYSGMAGGTPVQNSSFGDSFILASSLSLAALYGRFALQCACSALVLKRLFFIYFFIALSSIKDGILLHNCF